MESIFPRLSGISIEFPTVSFLGGGPIWYSETLEESSWSSVEVYISNTLQESVGMEVLTIDVIVNHWLLVEFVCIEVFNSNTYIILN